MGRGLRGRVASRRQKAASRGFGSEGDRIVSGGWWARPGGGEEEFSTERADPKLVVRAHPALCMWPLLRRPSCPAATGREGASCPVVFTVVRRVLVFVVVVVGVWFGFVSFRFVFFLVWLVYF